MFDNDFILPLDIKYPIFLVQLQLNVDSKMITCHKTVQNEWVVGLNG